MAGTKGAERNEGLQSEYIEIILCYGVDVTQELATIRPASAFGSGSYVLLNMEMKIQ